jgi:alkanesulfonate monooxygenase SsuD/methylene tetrahydromethanopterin reductase-like flavin-dependent oxidoreductase (luciferase family)
VKIDMFCEVEKANMQPGQDLQLLQETLAQAELADKVGYDCWWEVEHHGAVDLSYSSAPELLLTAISQRTKRMRIGHGAVLAPHNINHPIRIAERAATLDLLSGGRLELGFARSTIPEWRTFQTDPDDTRNQHREAMQMVPEMWTNERFSWNSERFQINDLSVIPKPLQKPHPPMWSASSSEDAFRIAGELGVGVLGVTLMLPLDTMAAMLQIYRNAIKTADPVGAFINNQAGVFTFVHCAETMDQAIQNGAAAACAWYQTAIVRFFEMKKMLEEWEAAMVSAGDDHTAAPKLQAGAGLIGDIQVEGAPEPTSDLALATQRIVARLARGEDLSDAEVFEVLNAQDSVIIGDPSLVREKMQRYQDIGVDRLLCFQQVGGLSGLSAKRSSRTSRRSSGPDGVRAGNGADTVSGRRSFVPLKKLRLFRWRYPRARRAARIRHSCALGGAADAVVRGGGPWACQLSPSAQRASC